MFPASRELQVWVFEIKGDCEDSPKASGEKGPASTPAVSERTCAVRTVITPLPLQTPRPEGARGRSERRGRGQLAGGHTEGPGSQPRLQGSLGVTLQLGSLWGLDTAMI